MTGLAMGAGAAAVGYGVATTNKGAAYNECMSDCDGIRQTGLRYRRIANATAAISAGAALGAVIAFVMESRRDREPQHTVSVSPNGVAYTHQF